MRTMNLFAVIALSLMLMITACQNDPTGSNQPTETEDDNLKDDGDVCERVDLPTLEPPDLTQGPSVVTLDENGTFVVNDRKFWPYGFYSHPDNDNDMAEFVDAGFNTGLSYGGCCQGGTLQAQIDRLEYLAQWGVMGAVHAFSPVDQIYSETEATLEGWLDERNDTGAMLFWYTYDEPALYSIPKQEASDYYAALSGLDPDHPNALVAAALEDYHEYVDYTDFLMIDPYPAPEYPLSHVRECYNEAHLASGGTKRVMGVGQSFDWYESYGQAQEGHVWRPTVREMRNMTYQYMVLGANGLLYFAYNYVHEQADRWEGLKGVAAEVTELMPLLVLPNSDKQVTRQPDTVQLDHALKELDGVYYLLAVSTWYDNLTVTFDLSSLGDELCVIDYFAETALDVVDGAVTIRMETEGDVVLQIIPQTED